MKLKVWGNNMYQQYGNYHVNLDVKALWEEIIDLYQKGVFIKHANLSQCKSCVNFLIWFQISRLLLIVSSAVRFWCTILIRMYVYMNVHMYVYIYMKYMCNQLYFNNNTCCWLQWLVPGRWTSNQLLGLKMYNNALHCNK